MEHLGGTTWIYSFLFGHSFLFRCSFLLGNSQFFSCAPNSFRFLFLREKKKRIWRTRDETFLTSSLFAAAGKGLKKILVGWKVMISPFLCALNGEVSSFFLPPSSILRCNFLVIEHGHY